MKDKDIYLGLELVFTFLLLILVLSLLEGALPSQFKLYVVVGLTCGFCFSWFTREKEKNLIKPFVTVSAVGIFAWLVYSIVNSTFFYKEIILISIKASLILEMFLVFSADLPLFLAYIQALSLPLFMSHPLFIKGYFPLSIILDLGYVICWFAILKVKFYGHINHAREIKRGRYYAIYLLVGLFILSIFISWIFFSQVPLGNLKKGGLFPEEESGLGTGLDDLETEYYDLQDDVQKRTTRLIPGLLYTEDRYGILQSLNKLIKEQSNTMEVKRAEAGLTSRLKAAGPGLEKGETEELTILIKKYTDKKSAVNLKRAKDRIRESLGDNRFKIKEVIPILMRVSGILYSRSYQEANTHENAIRKIINNSSSDAKAKKELKELTGQLKEWKDFGMYRAKLASLEKKIDSLDGQLKSEFKNLLLDVDKIEGLSDLEAAENKIKKLKTETSGLANDIVNEMEEFLGLKSQILVSEESRRLKEKLEESGLPEHKTQEMKEGIEAIKDAQSKQQFSRELSELQARIEEGQVNVSQETKELADLKTYVLTEEEKREDLARGLEKKAQLDKENKARIMRHWLRAVIFWGSSFSILGIIIMLGVLWFLTENKKNKLKFLLNKDPREFIVGLYENIKKIFNIFNLSCKEFLPPLVFAELVQKRYSLEGNLFLRFTAIFEEAKYSQHILESNIALLVLDDYNNLLKILFSRYNSLSLFSKYCQALFKRIPLFIPKR